MALTFITIYSNIFSYKLYYIYISFTTTLYLLFSLNYLDASVHLVFLLFEFPLLFYKVFGSSSLILSLMSNLLV